MTLSVLGAALFVAASAASAQEVTEGGTAQDIAKTFTLWKTFTFLLVTLGPFNVLAPFSAMTHGRDKAFKRQLAFKGTGIAAVAVVISATLGAMTLRDWGVSTEAILLTGGIILLLVALRLILQQYAPSERQQSTTTSAPSSSLAFSPLAFPTIVTPYGIAVLVVALRLRPSKTPVIEILTVTAVVLAFDLLAMLLGDRILNTPFVASALNIIGTVMTVLQVALGIEMVMLALRLAGVIPTVRNG